MATTLEYVDFVCEQIDKHFVVRYRKMFGEYMIYLNDKPAILVCDNTVYIKKHEALRTIVSDEQVGYPYPTAKLHYILDVENQELLTDVLNILEPLLSLPKPKKSKKPKIKT